MLRLFSPLPKKTHIQGLCKVREQLFNLYWVSLMSPKSLPFFIIEPHFDLCVPLWESNSMLIKKQRDMSKKTLMESTHDKHIIPCIVIWWRNLLPTKTWICIHSAHWKKIWEMVHGTHASTAKLLRASPYPVCSLVILASKGTKITIHEQYFSAFLWVLSNNS